MSERWLGPLAGRVTSFQRASNCLPDHDTWCVLAGKSRRRVNEGNEPSSSVSNSSRLPPVGAAGLSWVHFIDQVACYLRGYRHIRIGNGSAGAGDVPDVA